MKINPKKILFRGVRIDNNKIVTGWLLSNKAFYDSNIRNEYYILGNVDYNIKSIVTYLQHPIKYSHLKDSVYIVYINSIEMIIN